MNELFIQNKRLSFFFGSIVVLLVGMFVYIIVFSKPLAPTGKIVPVPTPYPTIYPKIIKAFDPSQLSLAPNETTRLLPGQKQTFRIGFASTIDTRAVTMQLTQSVIPEEETTITPVTIVRDAATNTFIVTMLLPVAPISVYRLTIINSQTKNVLYQAKYISQDIEPTPVTNNDETLKQYLPYETDQFSLSYNASRNVYVFNLKILANDPSDLESQYQKAKQAAESFIRSKNIDPTSLVIEWRRS